MGVDLWSADEVAVGFAEAWHLAARPGPSTSAIVNGEASDYSRRYVRVYLELLSGSQTIPTHKRHNIHATFKQSEETVSRPTASTRID